VVPLLNRPFLAYQLALLREHGVTDVILACSYRVDDVRAALGEAEHLGVRLRYVIEAEPLGTGGGVRNAADLTAGTVFVLNGDVLSDVDLSAMRDFHEARGSRTTIFLTRVADPRAYGLVETGSDGRLQRFREKPGPEDVITTDTINAGVYLIDASLLSRMPHNRIVSIEREFFPGLIADGVPCYGWLADTYWRDIGSPHAYREAQRDLLLGRARMPLPPPGEKRDDSWVDASATIAAGAHIVAPSVIGAGVRVMEGARVGPLTVVGEGSRIGAGAHIDGSVLWERVEVGAAAVLRDCVVGADVKIGAHADIGPHVILESGAVIPEHTHLTAAPR
jgi:mannose-1-phosphate guanylyltransferase